MPFNYPQTPHTRRHGPRGYQRYQAFKPWLRDECMFRCVYCLVREKWHQDGSDIFGVDHIFPKSLLDPTRECDYSNLAYACNRCNRIKRDKINALDPFAKAFGDLLFVSEDGSITARNPQGEHIIRFFNLDSEKITEYRARIIHLINTYTNSEKLRSWMGFPSDIPDLRLLAPPHGNDRPEGIEECYFVQRELGLLPDTY